MQRDGGSIGGSLIASRSEEEVRREEEISDALGEVLERVGREEDQDDVIAGGNLSGVVRSSLDLICPPPSRDEGATFEGLSEERRVPRLCGSGEESQERCGGGRGGGVVLVGEEGGGEGDGEGVRGEGNSTGKAKNTGSRKVHCT